MKELMVRTVGKTENTGGVASSNMLVMKELMFRDVGKSKKIRGVGIFFPPWFELG